MSGDFLSLDGATHLPGSIDLTMESPNIAAGQAHSRNAPPSASTVHSTYSISSEPSPATAKMYEKSLHELDDLIQQRRKELSAMKKSHKKRNADAYMTGTRRIPTSIQQNNTATSMRYEEIYNENKPPETPMMTPQTGQHAVNPMMQNTNNSFNVHKDVATPAGGTGTVISISRQAYEELKSIEAEYHKATRQLQSDAEKIGSLEKCVQDLDDQCAQLTQKARLNTQERERIDDERLRMEEAFSRANEEIGDLVSQLQDKEELTKEFEMQIHELKLTEDMLRKEVQSALEAPMHSLGASSAANVPERSSPEAHGADLGNHPEESDDHDFDERIKEIMLEKEALTEEIVKLQAIRMELEADVQAAAKSAFDWEAHANAISSHYETVLKDANERTQVLMTEVEHWKTQASGSNGHSPEHFNMPTMGDESEPTTVRDDVMGEPSAVPAASDIPGLGSSGMPPGGASLYPPSKGLSDSPGAYMDGDAGAVISKLENGKNQAVKIAKTWMTVCSKAWVQSDQRRLFDILRLNVLLEQMKRKYQSKCVEYLKEERVRIQRDVIDIVKVQGMTALESTLDPNDPSKSLFTADGRLGSPRKRPPSRQGSRPSSRQGSRAGSPRKVSPQIYLICDAIYDMKSRFCSRWL